MVYDQTSTGNCSLFTFFLSLHIGRGRCSNLHTQDLKERNKKHKKKISRVSKNFPLKIALYLFFIFWSLHTGRGRCCNPHKQDLKDETRNTRKNYRGSQIADQQQHKFLLKAKDLRHQLQ